MQVENSYRPLPMIQYQRIEGYDTLVYEASNHSSDILCSFQFAHEPKLGGSNNVSTDAISNKEAWGTHFHLDTLIAVILKWAVAPTTKTGGFFVFDVDAEPCIDDGHGGGN